MNEIQIPSYAVHNEKEIRGFFGDYRFLSNFYPAETRYIDRIYPSAENAYQAVKVDPAKREEFLVCSPAEAKKLWKKFPRRYSAEQWNGVKLDVMRIIVFDKFWRNQDLRKMLLHTGNKYLEETNIWKDEYWGVYCKTGRGENCLGKILMKTREFFR